MHVPWPRPADGDPAEWLENWLTEIAGIREFDGNMTRADATAAAWRDVLAAVERGERMIEMGAGTGRRIEKERRSDRMKPAPTPRRRPAGGTT